MEAYKLFAESLEVKEAIEEFVRSCNGATTSQLKAASEKCVSSISASNLPHVVKIQVSSGVSSPHLNGFESEDEGTTSYPLDTDSKRFH